MAKIKVGGEEIEIGRVPIGRLEWLLENGHIEILRASQDSGDDKHQAKMLRTAAALVWAVARDPKITVDWIRANMLPEQVIEGLPALTECIGPKAQSPNAASP
jgi:hypothetical protein